MEYIVIMSFVVIIIITIMAITVMYSSSINDQIKINQIANCAKKLVANAENIYYIGEPSRATINCYLPDNIRNISILNDSIVYSASTRSGPWITSFESNVVLNGSLKSVSGIRKIKIRAYDGFVNIDDS